MRLLLIRHGQTPNNVVGALDTAPPGAGLTAVGHAQAAAVAAALAEESIVAVYASTLVRTQLTAAPLAEALGVDVQIVEGIEEISAGAYEMRSDADAVTGYVSTHAAWLSGHLERPMSGGPDGHAFLTRYREAVAKIAAEHGEETVAVFSHGAAIRVFTGLTARGIDPVEATEWRIANTGISILVGDPEAGWTLERWSTTPLGGEQLLDQRARDVTGDSRNEAVVEAEVAQVDPPDVRARCDHVAHLLPSRGPVKVAGAAD